MIRKYIIKTVAIILTFFLFSVTAADMYIKTVGDSSGFRAYPEIEELSEKLALSYPKKNSIRVMTYNLLADSVGFEGSDARSRSNGVCEIISTLSPDAIALQETSRKWYACLVNNSRYKLIHPLRTGVLGTMTALAYDPFTLSPVISGDEVFTSGNSSPLRRMVWAVFRHKSSGVTFAVISTHLSIAQGKKDVVPIMQALELCELSRKLNSTFNCPVILAGDFNAEKSTEKTPSAVFDALNSYSFFGEEKAEFKLTLSNEGLKKVKDHIFHSGELKAERYCILSHKSFLSVSDHYPVFIDFYL